MSDLNVLRVGVVGATGLFAPTYLNPAVDLPDLELRAIAARRPGPLAETAAAYGMPDTHTDWRDLVARDDLDVVAIVTSNAMHHPVAIAALESGKHVLCEKPLANTAEQCAEMVAAAESSELGHGLGHYMRFAEPMQTVRRLIDEGEIGEVQAMFGRIWQPRALHEPVQWWMTEEECPAGSIGLLGVHLLDLARYLTDSEITAVMAHLPIVVPERPDMGDISRVDANRWSVENPQGADPGTPMAQVTASDFGTIHGEMASGALFTFTAGQTTFTRPGPTPDVQVHGSRASAFVRYSGGNRRAGQVSLVRGVDTEVIDVPVRVHESPRAQNTAMFREIVIPGLRASAAGEPSRLANFHDGLAVARAVDAARESERTRAWVAVG
ncbi:MAG: Gfo/Idh/MocA family oxidoreductase [Chloroflexota bacterium]|nr:Gfo/Idh/MocA family oxidoreductase [Chloroflexota bacterium]